MNILIESSNADYNWGDASMLVVAIQRLKKLFPNADITLLRPHRAFSLTEEGDVLKASSEGRASWFAQRPLWGRMEDRFIHLLDRFYALLPRLFEMLGTLKMRALDKNPAERRKFIDLFDDADVLVVSGGGFMTDLFGTSDQINSLMQLAFTRDVPVYMFGQGIGPIDSKRLFSRTQYTLPKVKRIALREGRSSRPLVRQIGVPEKKISVTGDDAVSLAYSERAVAPGKGIGVNLRVAYYSKVKNTTATIMAQVLMEATRDLGAPLKPVPIAFEGSDSDIETIKKVLAKCGVESDGGSSLKSLKDVLQQVSQCRVVVTGSYHAGVFALSQGTPVVALTQSAYYDDKFHGLADMFGKGCRVLRTDQSDFKYALRCSIRDAWEEAESVRSTLLEAAQQQIEASENAYERLGKEIKEDFMDE